MTAKATGSRSRSQWLVVGQLVGQASLLVATPVLARVYGIESIGTFQAALAFALVLLPLSTLKADLAIPAASDDGLVQQIARRAHAVVLTLAALLGVGGTVLLLDGRAVGMTVWQSSAILVVLTWTSVDSARLLRQGRVGLLAVRNAATGLLAVTGQVLLGLAGMQDLGLVVGYLAGRWLAVALTSSPSHEDAESPAARTRGVARLGPSRGPLVKGVVGEMLAVVSYQGLVLVSGCMSSARVAGELGMAQRIAGAPAGLLGQGLGQLAVVQLAGITRAEEVGLARAFALLYARLATVAVLLALGVAVVGVTLSQLLLGPAWTGTGALIAVLALPLCAALPTNVCVVALNVVERQGLLARIQLVRAVTVVAVLALVAMSTGSAVAMATAFSAVTLSAYAALLWCSSRQVRSWERRRGLRVEVDPKNAAPQIPEDPAAVSARR